MTWAERIAELRRRAVARGLMATPPEEARCPLCDGTKWAIVEAEGKRWARRCPRCTAPVDALGAPTVPHEFRQAWMDTYEELPGNRAAIEAAKAWLRHPHHDVYLFGGIGSGKTRLACSMLNEYYRRHRVGMFARVSGLLFGLQPKEDRAHERLWTRAVEHPVLVLDDLGAEREEATDFSRRMILQLYEERCDRGHCTIWTSNQSLGDLSEQMQDDRLASRLAGRATLVRLMTEDLRVARRGR